MKAAVIGCNGYIGKHLVDFLLRQGWDVQGYGTRKQADFATLSYRVLRVEQKADFEQLDTDVDYIFYFSGITGVAAAYNQYEQYLEVNEKGILNLLDCIRNNGSRARIVFPSTRLVYKGLKDGELAEDAEKEYKTIYALNKWFGEQALQQYSNYFGLSYTIFRIGVPFGNLFDETYSYGTIGFFLTKARSGETITLFGDGDQKRTFTHVEDICRQIFSAVLQPESRNNIYNIMGETFALKQVAQKIADRFGVQVKTTPWPPLDALLESGDTIFNSSKIAELLGQPLQYHFDEWLRKV